MIDNDNSSPELRSMGGFLLIILALALMVYAFSEGWWQILLAWAAGVVFVVGLVMVIRPTSTGVRIAPRPQPVCCQDWPLCGHEGRP